MKPLLLLVCLVCACASDPGAGSGTIDGTIAGAPTAAIADAISITGKGTGVIMTSTPGACHDLGTNTLHPGQQTTVLTLLDKSTGGTTGVGDYPIGSTGTRAASLQIEQLDADCKRIGEPNEATSGTITLTDVSGQVLTGTFDLELDTGDHITGSFAPVPCGETIPQETVEACE